MIRRIHPIAGAIALITILSFWTGTVSAELLGSPDTIAAAKRAILWGFVILIPAMAAAGATGFRLGGNSRNAVVTVKKQRMPFIAANGLLILMPSAFYLDHLAAAGDFGTVFFTLQSLELAAGAVNIALLSLNMRDGLRLTRRRRTGLPAEA